MATAMHQVQEVIDLGRAGAANVGVIPEVETVNVLEYLQKTPPPVVIFRETNADVDALHIYLLLRSVEAVAFHGGKSPQARQYAIASMKARKKDVLVATKVELQNLENVLGVSLSDPVPVRFVMA